MLQRSSGWEEDVLVIVVVVFNMYKRVELEQRRAVEVGYSGYTKVALGKLRVLDRARAVEEELLA